MKSFFQFFRDCFYREKENWYSAKTENLCALIDFTNFILISIIYFFVNLFFGIAKSFYLPSLQEIEKPFLVVTALAYIVLVITPYSCLMSVCSFKVLRKLFGRYGKVIDYDDWKNLELEYPKVYKWVRSRKSIGYCYNVSFILASMVRDAELLFLGVYDRYTDKYLAHCVVLKNGYIYDTNDRLHYTAEDYMRSFKCKIYKAFSKDEYYYDNFLNDTFPKFDKWCEENNVEYLPSK